MATFIELYEQRLAKLGQTVVKVYTENCHWCKKLIARPTAHNFVHVGGKGDVPCCDKCLKGEGLEWQERLSALTLP